MNKWKEIWNSRKIYSGTLAYEELVLELKKLNGFDLLDGKMDYDSFYSQHKAIYGELEYNRSEPTKLSSIFEVGCGSGADLLMFQHDGLKVGGLDYSDALIQTANKVLSSTIELYCDEAINLKTDIKYDSVFSNSVFSYFPDLDYAQKVLSLMLSKTNYSIGLIDIHDKDKEIAFINYRKSLTADYEERYKDLNKLFYPKQFFIDFAEENKLSVKFTHSKVKGYWNNEYLYNVFLMKK